MRYEHIELDFSVAACAALSEHLEECHFPVVKYGAVVEAELDTLRNELRARLQRTDVDVQCTKNFPTEEWLNT